MLLAACGDDSDDAAGGGSASTSEESAGGGGDGGGEVQVVNILPPQLGYSAEYIADIDGYFKKEGLSVKVDTARGSAPAIQAVLSGTALLSWVRLARVRHRDRQPRRPDPGASRSPAGVRR